MAALFSFSFSSALRAGGSFVFAPFVWAISLTAVVLDLALGNWLATVWAAATPALVGVTIAFSSPASAVYAIAALTLIAARCGHSCYLVSALALLMMFAWQLVRAAHPALTHVHRPLQWLIATFITFLLCYNITSLLTGMQLVGTLLSMIALDRCLKCTRDDRVIAQWHFKRSL